MGHRLKSRTTNTGSLAGTCLTGLLLMYVVTGILILITAFFLYRFELPQQVVSVLILLIYVLSGFVGGFYAGGRGSGKKLLWGIAMGGMYFAILFLCSLLVQETPGIFGMQGVLRLLLCVVASTMGSMISR